MSEGMLPQPAPMAAPPVFEPKRLKVFGVIHIVFGAMGLLYTAFQVVALLFQDEIQKLGSAGQPPEMLEFQEEFNAATVASSWISILLGIAVAVLILVAGISLVRRRKNSLKLSNTYAWVSIGAKVVGIILFLVMVSPAMNKLFDDMVGDAPADVKRMMDWMKVVATVGGVLVPIIAAIYPMITLIALNKPVVKDFLKQHGT